MNCDDVKDCLNKDAHSFTVAERVAIVKHFRGCEQCNRLLDEEVEKHRDDMSEDELKLAMNAAQRLYERDLQDPECGL